MIVFIIFFLAAFVALSLGILIVSWMLLLTLFVFRVGCYVLIGLIAVIAWLTPQRELEPPDIVDLRWSRRRACWE